MLLYYRSVKSLVKWKDGKRQSSIESSEDKRRCLKDVVEGTGNPSIWLFRNNEDLERIALGMLLSKGHLESINLIGFQEICFTEAGLEIQHSPNSQFPIYTVGELHYELLGCNDEAKCFSSINKFAKCFGDFKHFPKANLDEENNMRNIAKRYASEVGESHKNKLQSWLK